MAPSSATVKYTKDVKDALAFARDEARLAGHSYVNTDHLLVGLSRTNGPAGRRLQDVGLDPVTIRSAATMFRHRPDRAVRLVLPAPDMPYSGTVDRVVARAVEDVRGSGTLGSLALLRSLAEEDRGIARRILRLRLDPAALCSAA